MSIHLIFDLVALMIAVIPEFLKIVSITFWKN